MKVSASCLVLLFAATARAAFVPSCSGIHSRVVLKGYLDDLSTELYAPADEPDPDYDDSAEATKMKEADKDRAGPGSWEGYVDFDEFDGGDGQMGVAGDGKKGLEKFGSDVSPSLAKSKSMSAKNAWGTNTGYAAQLMKENPTMDISRAQQLENWHNQQEVKNKQQAQKSMAEDFDKSTYSEEENWRMLSKFGVQRNSEFDLESTFGAVTPGTQIDGVIELKSVMNQITMSQIALKNDYMGFADFRASFTPETSNDWTVDPSEGSLTSREPTTFTVKFRPSNPGITGGYLVIETEDMKKTFQLVGST